MKKVILYALMIVSAYFKSYGQASSDEESREVIAPNFLVHRQLTPELIKIEYAAPLSSGVFKDNEGHTQSQLKTSTFTVSGYPLTLIRKTQRQLYMGFGYTQDKYMTSEVNEESPFLNQTAQSFNVNVFLNTRIKGNFYWFSYLQGGVQGSHPFDEVKKSHNEIVLNKINYRASRNMNIGIGMAYASNQGNPVFIPAVAFVYSRPHYLINIDFPVKAEMEGIFANGKWRPVIGVTFPSNTYYLKSVNQYFNTSGLVGYIGTRYRILDFLYLHATWQTGLNEIVQLGDKSNPEKVGTFTGQNRLVISLNIQMARFIPSSND